jgi:hypothetical protein
LFIALAASVAVWANLSSTLLNQPVGSPGRAAVADIDLQAERLVALVPELSKEFARGEAARMSAGIRWSTPLLRPSAVQSAVR